MNDTDLDLAQKVAIQGERIETHTNQLLDMKGEIKEIKEDQKALYEIATSIKLVVQDVSGIKSDVKDIKQGQSDLTQKVDTKIADVNKEVDDKIANVTEKVLTIEKKGTWDWMGFITKTLIPGLVMLGIGAYIAQMAK